MTDNKNILFFIILLLLTIVVAVISTFYGAVPITLNEIISSLKKSVFNPNLLTLNEHIFLELRLPRVILCLAVGASLALGGTLLQALFRNPIVEPGMIGISSGAAFGAAFYIVLGSSYQINSNFFSLPITAFVGALFATSLVFLITDTKKNFSIISVLLIGIAINALFLSGIGILSYFARDPQARSITFWSMGTLSGANWTNALTVSTVAIICIVFSLRIAKELNTLILGEEEAYFIGSNVKKLKLKTLLINVILISIATSFVGVISFVGLIVPHILRLLNGPDNRFLTINSVLLGGLFLCISDLIARIIFSPAELPIGIITSFVGAPIFIYLLRKTTMLK